MRYLVLILMLVLPATSFAASNSVNLSAASTQSVSASDSTSLSPINNQTYEAWYKFTSIPASGAGMNLFSKYIAGAGTRGFSVVYENSAGTLRFHSRTSTDGTAVVEGTANYTLSSATWYYIRFVYSSTGSIDVYVDDMTTSIGSMSAALGIKDNTAPFNIGVNADITSPLDGRVSVFRVWSITHTTADKCTVYGTPQSSLAAEWSLDNVLTDASGNSNTLTNNNSATFTADVPACLSPSVPTGVPMTRATFF